MILTLFILQIFAQPNRAKKHQEHLSAAPADGGAGGGSTAGRPAGRSPEQPDAGQA